MIRPTGPAIQPRGPCDLVPVLVLLVLGSVLASRSAATSPPFSAPAHRLPGGVPAERSFRLPSSASTAVPFEYRLLVVLVEFRDVRASRGDDRVTPELVYERLFGDGAGTLSSYWREASNGRLLIRGTVTPWVRVDSTYASYASAGAGNLGSGIDPDAYPHNAPRLVEEAIGRLGGGYRFQDFDNNRDGTVDGLLVIHAGPGLEEATRTPPPDPRLIFLAHQSHTRRELTVPGSVVFDYAFVSVGAGHGVAAHEFGHLLGLKDLYDTGFFAGRNGPFGVGDWSLMGTGALVGGGDMPTGLDADSRIRLGFIEPTVIVVGEPPGDIDVVRGDHPVYKFGAGSDPREYFLLEPRWRQGIDAGLPGEGFLIWHIDERQTANRGPDLYRVALVQPDGRNDLGRTNGNRGDAGDVWPTPTGSARDRFDDTTTPSARTNAGLPSTVSIRGMSRSADRLRAIYQISPDVAIELGDLEVTEINGDGDGRVEPTETANIDVTLCNRGESASGPLTLTLMIDPTSSDNFQVGVPVVMEAISAGGCGRTAQPLSLTILPGGFEPTAAGTILVVTDPEGGVMASIDLLLPLQPGPPITLTAAPGEPAWRAVALNPEQGAPWSVTTARFRTPPAAWRLGPTVGTRYAPNLDAAWLSPVFVVPARHPQLTVWSVMDAETLATGRAFDGGRFEIQSGLSDWQALSPAGGWPFELESASGNALAGEECFSGHDVDFQRWVFDLADHAGKATRIRYRFASDDVTSLDQGQSGWWLDDFEVSSTDPPPDVTVAAVDDSATVTWSSSGPTPITWQVHRRADVSRARRRLIGMVTTNVSNDFRTSLVDHPPVGRWIYSIRPITPDGPGLEFEATAVVTSRAPSNPELDVYPNPWRLDGPPLNIEYLLPGGLQDQHPVIVRLYDVAGRLVETVIDGVSGGGLNRRRWPISSVAEQPAPGVYFVRLEVAGRAPITARLVISR